MPGIMAFRFLPESSWVSVMVTDAAPGKATLRDLDSGAVCTFDPNVESASLPLEPTATAMHVELTTADGGVGRCRFTWPEPEPEPAPVKRRARTRKAA
jgi:hypothetical protein